jgi:serine/threonine-protein kinase
MTLQPGTRLGHYEITSLLGSGGMGEVYRAKDHKLGRDVAIKVLREELASDPERLRRFEQEARSASALNHPNIITIYDIGKHDTTPYIAMEYVEGKTLREMLAEGPLPTKNLLQLATQIAEGLAKAHAAGIIHRDLKPENLMISSDGYVKILDFGLAKLLPEQDADSEAATITKEGTVAGAVMGTASYMSPEQAKGQAVDFRADQFSLGASIYEMATGERAFQRDSPVQTLSAVIEYQPESISTLSPDKPSRLSGIVERCLEKSAEDRYNSTRDLSRELRYTLEELPRSEEIGGPNSRKAIDSIVVLPLVDLKPEPGEEYFADGMTESLITDLAKIGSLRVISRTSAMRYKGTNKSLPEIAKELNVEAVLEGSVLKVGQRVRITAQLIKANTDEHLWAEAYDRDLHDVLALQSDLATSIAKEIQVRLTPDEKERLTRTRRVDPQAHEACLKGHYHIYKMTEEGILKGIQYFEQAKEVDPTFAPAYSGLAEAFSALGFYAMLPPKRAFPRAKSWAKKALELDETIAEAHAWLAYSALVFDWDWPSAEREIKRAVELNPNHAWAHLINSYYLNSLSRFDESLVEVHRAQELDPLSILFSSNVAIPLWFSRQYDLAIEQLRETLELDESFPVTHFLLGSVYTEMGKYEDAIAELRKADHLVGGIPFYSSWLGRAYGLMGQRDEAIKVLAELEKLSQQMYVSAFHWANVYLGLGDSEQALVHLKKAFEEHAFWLFYIKADPSMDPLREDSRFQDLLRRMNFPE